MFAQGGSGGEGEKDVWIQDILLSQMGWIFFAERQREFEEKRFPLGNWVAWMKFGWMEIYQKGKYKKKLFFVTLESCISRSEHQISLS